MIISFCAFVLIIAIWFYIQNHLDQSLHDLISIIEENIADDIAEKDWNQASISFSNFKDRWHQHQELYNLFINQDAVMEVNYAIVKTEAYIQNEDVVLSLGELAFIKEHLNFLHQNELVTLENIF